MEKIRNYFKKKEEKYNRIGSKIVTNTKCQLKCERLLEFFSVIINGNRLHLPVKVQSVKLDLQNIIIPCYN